MSVQKSNEWYKAQIHIMVNQLQDNAKLHFIWTILHKYIQK